MAYVLTIHCCRCDAAIEVAHFPRHEDPIYQWVEFLVPHGRFNLGHGRRDHLCPTHAAELLPADALAKLRDPRKRIRDLPDDEGLVGVIPDNDPFGTVFSSGGD